MRNYSQIVAAYNAANDCFEADFKTLAALLLLLKKKRKPPHKLYRQRIKEGAFNILVDRHLLDDETKFKEYFRLTPFLFNKLLDVLKEDLEGIPTNWNPNPISADQKFCITLRYLATGESFRSLAFQYRVHYSTIGRIVQQCLDSIISHFLKQAMPTPTIESLKQVIDNFFLQWNFPNCCGAIDGKHVRIKCPPRAGSAFFNYKDYHSMVLLAIVDANYKYIAVDVGAYGREGDAGIFLNSVMGTLINDGNYNIPPPAALPLTDMVLPNVIIGDEAFALTNTMMKPYPRAQSLYDDSKAIYNYRHCRARRTTENAFGIMSSYFRIFFTPIQTTPRKIDKIILASCILHNFMREEKIPSPSEPTFNNTENITSPSKNLIPIANVLGRPATEGTFIREKFKDYFNGDGAVEWQRNMIR